MSQTSRTRQQDPLPLVVTFPSPLCQQNAIKRQRAFFPFISFELTKSSSLVKCSEKSQPVSLLCMHNSSKVTQSHRTISVKQQHVRNKKGRKKERNLGQEGRGEEDETTRRKANSTLKSNLNIICQRETVYNMLRCLQVSFCTSHLECPLLPPLVSARQRMRNSSASSTRSF